MVGSERVDQADVMEFLGAADLRAAALYPLECRFGMSAAALVAAGVRFFVARRGGRALGCGGYVLLADGTAEMKRLFVDPAARRLGVGGALVTAIEIGARGEGVGTLWLETGVRSHEALGLYRRSGFVACGPFAGYRANSSSVFMRKTIGSLAGG